MASTYEVTVTPGERIARTDLIDRARLAGIDAGLIEDPEITPEIVYYDGNGTYTFSVPNLHNKDTDTDTDTDTEDGGE